MAPNLSYDSEEGERKKDEDNTWLMVRGKKTYDIAQLVSRLPVSFARVSTGN